MEQYSQGESEVGRHGGPGGKVLMHERRTGTGGEKGSTGYLGDFPLSWLSLGEVLGESGVLGELAGSRESSG